jgi:NitT/TauT family transport system ATP-binding protein
VIELRGVSYAYPMPQNKAKGPQLVLEDVTMRVEAGNFVSVVGPSGCGKTTLLKLIAGLLKPVKGEIVYQGSRGPNSRPRIGMAFQNAVLLPWRTVLENVIFPLEIVKEWRSELRRRKHEFVDRALTLLRSVGLEEYAQWMPWELSGGMQQRVSLCRALIHEPEVLLLDEPFGALDMMTREELWVVLQKLWTEGRCTVVMVTHDLREAVFLSDKIYVLGGRPAKVIGCVEVRFPRPRPLDICYRDDFVRLTRDLRLLLERSSLRTVT